jgi:hypothetical protein
VSHASAGEPSIVGGRRVEWQAVSPEEFDVFIFVCGPILKYHDQTQTLFKKFDGILKIGVGVSLFPSDHFNYLNPFNEVLAREGANESFEDVAIVAPPSIHRPQCIRRQSPTIGISLRGMQSEYGDNVCLWELTEKIAHEAAKRLISEYGGRIIIIENHLQRSGLTQEAIESIYADCDLIITSRFHGAMVALRHIVPFIAIDQIKGGAKVLNLVGSMSWPYVYQVGDVDSSRVFSDATKLLEGGCDQMLFDVRTCTMEQANRTLYYLGELLHQAC